jgi:redox-sensitive bicupin YhaK (pirin superfamily)
LGKICRIKKILKSVPTIEGAGVHLKRAFGNRDVPELDPFLLLDDFHSNNKNDYIQGFPWHPHRGIETITYVLQGSVEHGDSLGNEGVILSGDIQWMTSGSGIIHQEMPKGDDNDYVWGFQLWANLPRVNKMMNPRYRDIEKSQVPEVITDNGVKLRIISGRFGSVSGPVKDIVIDPEYMDITVPANRKYRHQVKEDSTVFAYIIGGTGYFDLNRDPFSHEMKSVDYQDLKNDCLLKNENLIIFDKGDEILIETDQESVRFLLVSGKPIGEPIAWYGPIVMNTQEELRKAFEDYQNGTFIKK